MQPHDVAEKSAARQPSDESHTIQANPESRAIQLAHEAQEEVPCPVCGEDAPELVMLARDRLFGRPGHYRLVRCTRCNMRYLSPRPSLSALGAHYPDDYFIYKTPEQTHPLMRPVLEGVGRQRWRSYIRRLERGRGR